MDYTEADIAKLREAVERAGAPSLSALIFALRRETIEGYEIRMLRLQVKMLQISVESLERQLKLQEALATFEKAGQVWQDAVKGKT